MLSVIVVTNRPGGLDALHAGLNVQTYTDFELILVDEIYMHRVLEVTRRIHYVKRHRPVQSDERWGNYMRALNTGVACSKGDRLVFWSDYTCAHPGTLAWHAKFHQEHPEDVMLGGIEYCETPPLAVSFPNRYGWNTIGHDVANHKDETYAPWLDHKRRHELYEEWRTAYEVDLDSSRLEPFMWSTFASPVQRFSDVEGLRVFNHDRRDTSPYLNLKNDSIPRSLLEKIGGFDERADGSHGHQDSITAKRLASVGAVLKSVPESPVRLLDAHGIAIIRRSGLNDEDNLRLLQ